MADHAHEHNELAHVASRKTLFGVFFALLVLTALTIFAAGLGAGTVDLMIALFIATVKATLVGLYFMHLRHDRPFNAIMFIGSFIFVAVFIGAALQDSLQYHDTVLWDETLNQFGTGASAEPAGGPGPTMPESVGGQGADTGETPSGHGAAVGDAGTEPDEGAASGG